MTRYAIVVTIDTNHEPDAETVCLQTGQTYAEDQAFPAAQPIAA